MTLTKKSEGVYLDDSIYSFDKADGIIFDCDGVLIDITTSYDLAIVKTTQYVLENMANISDTIDVDFKIIDGFKSTGGFNDEVDLTYAAILSLVAAKKLDLDPTGFIFDVIKNSNSNGIKSVEKYVERKTDISEMKKHLAYPGICRESPLYEIFDKLFFGPALYLKLFGKQSEFSEPGLIEQDKVILTESLLEKLEKRFYPKIGLVTGRGKESVRYSLKDMLERFNLENSMFLEDEPRELAKPNPKPLYDSIHGMSSVYPLYVGDSMEDLIMSKRVSELGQKVIFCGITGTSKNPKEKFELFEQNGALLVIDSINRLPKVLNLE